ncbi:hypothetical protein SPONL_1565 [uncultured Candidatus Thioglobus sp.]|nr:hypothetical protein SPONL_1565 [uncultured Candidatus Thioglobus sp.]
MFENDKDVLEFKLKYPYTLPQDWKDTNRDLCINMNNHLDNHQSAIFHHKETFLKTPLALLGVDLKNSQLNKICHPDNYPYLYKGLNLL